MIRGKKKHMIILIISALILIALVYYFPLQRILAEKKYEQYATQQGVLAADIKNKDIYKDYKQGGYFISVKYHSERLTRTWYGG
jgi:ABC-type bacteriocin/lantibiotic exporter with double-glycine peptidase domain